MKGKTGAFSLGVSDNKDLLTLDTTTQGSEKIILEGSGGFQGANFIAASDKNLKTNIKLLENSLDKVKKMNGVSFNWKETDKESIGVIAQEIAAVDGCKSLVFDNGSHLGVNYNGLIGLLIESIKELNSKIDKLSN